MSLVVIIPARNEEAFIETTIKSVQSQTRLPQAFVIVDDGSTDATKEIIQRYHGIHLVSRKDRGFRHRGSGVAVAVNIGAKEVTKLVPDWSYLCKLDADISLPTDYFEKILEILSRPENTQIGIISGVVIGEQTNPEHPRGAARIYRRKCWEDIGGKLAEIHGWDTYSDLRARQFGWETRGIPDLRIIQSRPTAGREQPMKVAFQVGRIMALLGYHPLVAMARSLKLYFRNPIGLIILNLTYLLTRINQQYRILPPDYYKYVELEQKQRVLNAILKLL